MYCCYLQNLYHRHLIPIILVHHRMILRRLSKMDERGLDCTRKLTKYADIDHYLTRESAKSGACQKVVEDYLRDNTVIGLGSGTTIDHLAEKISVLVKRTNWNIKFVPTSYQAKTLLRVYGLEQTDLESHPELDLCIDGADEIDENLNLIKGGGGCLLQEKIVASCAKTLIIVADYSKDSTYLGEQYKKGIPIEVVPMAHIAVQNKIKKKFGGNLTLRMAKCKAGPVVTDNGNFILDWLIFEKLNWKIVNTELKLIPGIIETGLFIGMADKAYIGLPDGIKIKVKGPF